MFKGLGGLGDMAKMMKSAQELQTKMAQMQEDLNSVLVTGESGAGLVKATATAKGELKGLDIDPSIFNGDDKEGRDQGRTGQSRRKGARGDGRPDRGHGPAQGHQAAVLMRGPFPLL